MTAPATAPSPMLAMHSRYEAAWAEYNTIDGARTALDKQDKDDRLLDYHYGNAMKVSGAEADALRQAIFFQMPTTWQEAMILQFHICSIFDPLQKRSEEEAQALETAVDTLFDFMCNRVEADHERIGEQFQTGAILVFDKRRYRTGRLDLEA